MPPNDRAHRPPNPDLSKHQNSKAPVPSANGGSVQRSGSAIQSSSTQKSPVSNSGLAATAVHATAPGNVTAKEAKDTKRNPRPCVSSALKNLYPPPSPPGSNLPASLRLCVSALKSAPSKRKGAKTPSRNPSKRLTLAAERPAQRPGPRERWIATRARCRRSLQRLVERSRFAEFAPTQF